MSYGELAAALASRGIGFHYAADRGAALDYLRRRIPPGAAVMNGGSSTLEEIGFVELLASGRYRWLRPAIAATNEREERLRRRREATIADWLVGGANAVTRAGEIINVDGSGNRLAGYAFGAGNVILVAGTNKLVPDLAAAFERIRNTVAVQECRKLAKRTPCALTGRCDNDACRGPERQCGKILIIENEKIAGRMTLVLVAEPLGY
ncbi:MAG TPA: lactate utilization protein [Burkholderiales bacterium]|nr:lactate utilization protein [Burkholderiales bacterium]